MRTVCHTKPGRKKSVMAPFLHGSGATARAHVLVKPISSGIRTNLMIATDRRESGEVNWDGLKRRIEHAVEAGDLTDEALKGIKKRIEGAVEAGEMTREEADALYEKLEKSE